MFFNKHIILASKSTSRKKILKDCGVDFFQKKPKIDESRVKKEGEQKKLSTSDLTLVLAKAKGKSIKKKDALIIGSDTAIKLNGETINKAKALFKAAESAMEQEI